MPAHVATPTKDCGWVLIEDGFTLAREREVEVADPPSKWIFRPGYPVTQSCRQLKIIVSIPNSAVHCPSGETLNRRSTRLLTWHRLNVFRGRAQPNAWLIFVAPPRVFADLPARNIW
jgi:hypothetical protein